MCGIAGYVSAHGGAPPDTDGLRAAVLALAHRGPDQQGTYTAPGVSLGFSRLSIIDLPGGSQPMKNEDGSVVVVYNGEIWNYRDLRARLLKLGHTFATRSDTEVLVHGYEQWGDDLLAHLDGMFAFAIWDSRAERLLLARDRFGKKPLYFAYTRRGIAFGSDARSIFLITGQQPQIALENVGEYVFQRYVVSPGTLFNGVERLSPASRAIYDRRTLDVSSYWDIDVPPEPVEVIAEEVRELLYKATERRLMSDVPLGVLLSGGVDSTAIVALAKDAGARDLASFTVGFEDPLFDERARARAVAERLGTEHHELCIDGSEFLEAWVRLSWYRDDPIAEASEVPLLLLSEFAGRHVKVVLSGDGGDEVFGGYPKYRADAILRNGGKPAELMLRGALRALSRRESHRQLQRATDTLAIRDQYVRWVSWFRTPGDATSLLLSEQAGEPVAQRLAARLRSRLAAYQRTDEGRRMLLGDLFTYLPDNMLLRSDKVLMAGSLEGRMPLMDVALVQRATSASAGSRSALSKGKRLLRDAVAGLVPAELLRGPKRGFTVPVERFLMGNRRQTLESLLLSDRALERRIFDPDRLRSALRDSTSRPPDRALFTLVSLELWARSNLDEVTVTPKSASELIDVSHAGDPPSQLVPSR
jgi:asparagine synthase (glutamine-hydrolysing)